MSAEFKKSETPKPETKHATLLTAEQELAALLASPDCLHPELPVTDGTEQHYLAQLDKALAKGEFDDAAYGQLFTRLEVDNLSLAALYRFANLCYQHWQRQWPSASVLQTNQTEIERQAAQLHAMAQGRALFRRSGTPTRYYWGRINASGNDATEKGLFFACYPTFAAQGESVKAIYQAERITDATHIALCEAHTQAQRRQQSFNQLLQHSSLLHHRLQQHGHHAKVIVNLQLTWLYYRSGCIVSSLSIHKAEQAVFYFRQAMGQIARYTFTQQQPALPATLLTAAEQVRERIDQAMLDQAQQTLFAAQFTTLITRWQQCYQDAQLEAIYQLSQQTHALLTHAANVPLATKQPLIDTWLAGFNRSLTGEDDQEVRIAMKSAVIPACNPVQKHPHSLATVHQWLLTLAQQLQQHGAADRACTLLHAYQQLLIRRQHNLQDNLQATIDHTGQDKAPYIAVLATCEQALAELNQWLTTSSPVAESKTAALHTIPASAFPASTQAIASWRETLAQSLAANTKASDIYTANTAFARNLLAGICHEIEQQIGPAPCAYTLLGAGSFSRGEISPASDLDCALLVADASVKTVDKNNSNKVTFHPWFQCFLQLLQWKLASLPEGVLELDSKTMTWIIEGSWLGTSEGFIQQHLASQQPHDPKNLQEADNFGAQWFRWIYSSGNQPQQKDALFGDYQQRLQTFFHIPIGTSSLPAYQQLAPWSLAKHIGEPVEPHHKQLSFSPKSASENPVESKKSKHEVKASLSESSAKTTFTVLNVKRLSYRLINAILCYGRFYDVPSGMTTTREVLAYLKDRQFLPASFITRLETALDQLYTWRLRQHWAWLHHASELGENEVVLWPENATQQTALRALPSGWRGFYLDETETQQYSMIVATIAEVIGRSVEGFAKFAEQQPAAAVLPAVQSTALTSSPLSSSSITTTSAAKETTEVKETKREVSEEEAKVIIAAQSRAVAEAKAPTQPSATPLFNPLAAAVEWTLQQLAKPKEEKTSTEEPTKAQSKHLIWLAQAIQFGLPPGQEQQRVLEQLFAPTSNTTLTLEQQRYLLTVLVGAQYHYLDLRPFKTILTDKLLLPILRNADKQILKLNLSGCTQLTSDILKDIEHYCPYLKRLRINDQTNWKNIYVGNFAELTTLECNRATALTDIRFGQLPKLKKLSLANATKLEVLGNKGYWTSLATEPTTYAWSLPQLQQLNTQNCVLLRAVSITINNPQALIWQRQGCIALDVKVPSIFSDWPGRLVDTLKTNAPSDSLDLHNKTLANLSIHSKISFTTTQALDDHVSSLLSTSSSSSSITTTSSQTQHAVPLQATAEASDSEDDESKQSSAPISSMTGSPLTANGSSRSISTPPTTSTSSSSSNNSNTNNPATLFHVPRLQPTESKKSEQIIAEQKDVRKNQQVQQQAADKQASVQTFEEFSEDEAFKDGAVNIAPTNNPKKGHK